MLYEMAIDQMETREVVGILTAVLEAFDILLHKFVNMWYMVPYLCWLLVQGTLYLLLSTIFVCDLHHDCQQQITVSAKILKAFATQ